MQKEQQKHKAVYGTGEIARMLGVSTLTVLGWIQTGILVGYKMPGSARAHRKVERQKLIDFIKAQPNMPMPDELKDEESAQ